LKLIINFTYFL